jgi:hypothetical protein
MAILLLAASVTGAYSGVSGPRGTGQLDSTPGLAYGSTLTCPGVFPVKVSGRAAVTGVDSTTEILDVFAGPEHLVVKERTTRYLPRDNNRIRIAESSYGYFSVGGSHTSLLSTTFPSSLPYEGLRHLALNGLPNSLFFIAPATRQVVTVNNNPADFQNYFQLNSAGFLGNVQGKVYSYGHALFDAQGSIVSVNLALNASAGFMSTLPSDLRAAQRPATTVANLFNGNSLINYLNCSQLNVFNAEAGVALPSSVFPLFKLSQSSRTLPGFEPLQSVCSDYLELNSSAVGSLAANNTSIKAFAALPTSNNTIAYLAINSSNRVFAGELHGINTYKPESNHFFNFESPFYKVPAYTVPPFGFAGNVAIQPLYPTLGPAKQLWANAYPQTERHHQYVDVKATDYGFILLEQNTQQLHYMFSQHYAQLLPNSMQVPSKLIHVAPRSISWRNPWNMSLGTNPVSATGDSLYKTNNDPQLLASSSHIHGGGGHLTALGTYNGILVHENQISVWGSNRWGQCVVPASVNDYLTQHNGVVIDVAAAVGPLLLNSYNGFKVVALDEDAMEKAAREYRDSPVDGSNINQTFAFGSYPAVSYLYSEYARYAGHTNYYNMSGHVCVVLNNGRVFCWGNNTYGQCDVPAEIALVNAAGAIATSALADPVEEVACGGFHTIARTRGGAIYVWGAGSPAVSSTGYVTNAQGSPLRSQDSQSDYAVSSSVHFGQSHLNGDSNSGILYTPNSNPNGTSDLAGNFYLANAKYSAVYNVNGIFGNVVGQKTEPGFAAVTPVGQKLKGMIAAGAFHTVIIDSALKIQCIGAGRGNANIGDRGQIYRNYQGWSNPDSPSEEQRSMWGTSYDKSKNLVSYPHFCQGISQYSAPLEPTNFQNGDSIFRYRVNLLRQNTSTQKHRPFQDFTFKKVVCGPFSTHGIVHSIARTPSSTQIYSIAEQASVNGKVISWGRARPSEASQSTVGPTGVKLPKDLNWSETGLETEHNPCVNLNGTGSLNALVGMQSSEGILLEGVGNTRYFCLLNRSTIGNAAPIDSSNDELNNLNSSEEYTYCYSTESPVTISKFKVKDMAAGMDFAGYIGHMYGFQVTDRLSYLEQMTKPDNAYLAATFDYEASVFFVGGTREWMPQAFNPHSGFYFVKRNKIGLSPTPFNSIDKVFISSFEGNTALKVKTRSYYYGKLNQPSGAAVTLNSVNVPINYVVPATLQISSTGTIMTVNMDNRPVAWNGTVRETDSFSSELFSTTLNKSKKLDLSLLPSIPFRSIKTGKGHAVGITNGDWPIAKSLTSVTTESIPRVASDLGVKLGSSWTGQVFPNAVIRNTKKSHQPVLWAWGAGDGREFGTGLLSSGIGFVNTNSNATVNCCIAAGIWNENVVCYSLSESICAEYNGVVLNNCSQCDCPIVGGSPDCGREGWCCLFSGTIHSVPRACQWMSQFECEARGGATPSGFCGCSHAPPYGGSGLTGDETNGGSENMNYLLLGGPTTAGSGPGYDGGNMFGTNFPNTYGMWFTDVHALTRYDDSLTGTPADYATPSALNNTEPNNIFKNYKAMSNADGMTPEVNYYGEYRWNCHSDDYVVSPDTDLQTYSFENADIVNFHTHAIEALQAKPNFNLLNYPATPSTSLNGSNILNGTQKALIPVAYGMPWINTELDMSVDIQKCCTTAADSTTTNEKLNHLQEWHGQLSLEQQNETDYIVDYDAGSKTTAVVFASTADYPELETGKHLENLSNYLAYFTNSTNSLLRRFDKRKTCKVAITGYGCENQTAGTERILKDGKMVSVIPQLFARDAKAYCGDSFTAVTNPVRVHTFEANEGIQPLNFTQGNTKAFTFNIPAAKYSNRIRGLDVRLTLICTGSSNSDLPVNLADWNVRIPYKNVEWKVLGNFQRWTSGPGSGTAPVFIRGTNLHDSSVLSSTYVFSDRYAPNLAYSFEGEKEFYSEAGLILSNVNVAGTAYSENSSAYSNSQLYSIPPASTAITAANQKLGCYAPYSYDAINRTTINTWKYSDDSTAANAFLRFDEPTISLLITNTGFTANYSNLSLKVELVFEVDDRLYPMIVYGRNRSGIWNNAFGLGPAYQADYFAFTGNGATSDLEVQKACPCLLDPSLNSEINNGIVGRYRAVSFPADSSFVCGTRKYGPSGNPEIEANLLTSPEWQNYPGGLDSRKILGPVTHNFKAVFSRLMHRPVLNDLNAKISSGPTLYALPRSAFISPDAPLIPLEFGTSELKANVIHNGVTTVNRKLISTTITANLSVGSANLQRAILSIIPVNSAMTVNEAILQLNALSLKVCP